MRCMQSVEEKMHEKESSEWCRNMGIVEFLIRVTDASISGWLCMDHPKCVADIFEALVGAVFMDSGEDLIASYHARAQLTVVSVLLIVGCSTQQLEPEISKYSM